MRVSLGTHFNSLTWQIKRADFAHNTGVNPIGWLGKAITMRQRPARPLVAIPMTKYLLAAKNNNSTGMSIRVEAAIV